MSTLEMHRQLSDLYPILYSFTRRFTSDREESRDLVQETILKALLHKDKFRENTNLKAWLFTILRNTFINNYRRGQRSQTLRDKKELHLLNTEDTHTFNQPASTVEYGDTWNQIDSINSDLLIPFKMYVSGYKYHEIAEQHNLPIGTVKNRIFNARKEIQKRLTGY